MRQKYAYTVNILLKKTLIEEAFLSKKEGFNSFLTLPH